MRLRHSASTAVLRAATAGILISIGGALLAPAPAAAQSFFEMLFGSSKPVPQAPPPGHGGPARLLPPGIDPVFPGRMPPGSPFRSIVPADALDDPAARTDKTTTFRTLCVRMCDGYYWPISYATTRNRFHRDAGVCRSSCGANATLFFAPNPGGQIDDAIDLTGRMYARLSTAFRYRKTLVANCACKPEPWSETEKLRHERYALTEQAAATAPADRAVGEGHAAQVATAGNAEAASPGNDDQRELMSLPPRRVRSERPSAPAARVPTAIAVPAQFRPTRPTIAQQAPPSPSVWGGPKHLTWPGDAAPPPVPQRTR